MKRRGRPRHPDVLTPREWEVLDLVRQGFTNEMIAGRLEVSERTARFHVSEIISKLGVESRWAAAAWQPEPRDGLLRRVRLPSLLWVGAMAASLVLAAGLGVLAWGVWHGGSGDDGADESHGAMGVLRDAVDKFSATESYTRTKLENGQSLEEGSVDSHTVDGREYLRHETFMASPGHPQPYTHTVEWVWIDESGYQRDCGRGLSDCGAWRVTSSPKLLGGVRASAEADVAPLVVATEAEIVQDDGSVTHIHGRFHEEDALALAFGDDLDEFGEPQGSGLPFDVWIDNSTGLPQRLFYGEGLSTTEVFFSDYDAVVIEPPEDPAPADSVESR